MFAVLPLHEVVDITPIPPETKVVPPSGGLNTEISAVPGCAMSAATMSATNWRLLMNVVVRNELFQLTKESRRKSLPLTVNRNRLPPTVAPVGEIDVMDGKGGQVPQDSAVTNMIASTDVLAHLGSLAIGFVPPANWLTRSEVRNGDSKESA